MQIVRDQQGREWTLDVQWSHVETLIARGVDPFTSGAGGLVSLLYEVTKIQRKQRSVTEKTFARTLGAEAYGQAMEAIGKEIEEFFPAEIVLSSGQSDSPETPQPPTQDQAPPAKS